MARDLRPGLSLVKARDDRAAVRAEVDAGRVARVTGHSLAQHGEEACRLRQSLAHGLPAPSAVAGAPDRRGGVRREAAGAVAVERQRPDRVRVARVHPDREAEGRGQPLGDVVPAPAAVGGAPDAVMVLLVEEVAGARRAHHVVHAMPGLAVARRGRVVVPVAGPGVREPVAALPGRAAVLGGEDTRGRDADPELVGVRRVRDDVCRTSPAAPGSQLAAEGCSVRASIRSQVRPPSRLRKRLAAWSRHRAGRGRGTATRSAKSRRRRAAPRQSSRSCGRSPVVGRPVVHRALGEPGDLPALAAVLRAPDARAVPVAAAPAQIVPVAPSPTRWLIGQPAQWDP